MTSEAKRLSDSILWHELKYLHPQAERPGLHVPMRSCDTAMLKNRIRNQRKLLSRPAKTASAKTRPSWKRFSPTGRLKRAICTSPVFRLWNERSIKLQNNWHNWTRQKNSWISLFEKSVKPERIDRPVAYKNSLLSYTAKNFSYFELSITVFTVV